MDRYLKDTCQIFSGIPVGQNDFVDDGDVKVFQANSLHRFGADVYGDEEPIIDPPSTSYSLPIREASLKKIKDKKFIEGGDVLFKARAGSLDQIEAYMPFPKEHFHDGKEDKPYIATNSFIILRPFSEIIPDYLEWALNQFKEQLSQFIQATTVLTINIKQLELMIIPVPSLKKQEAIVEAYIEIEKAKAINDARYYLETERLKQLAKNMNKEKTKNGRTNKT